MLFRSGHCESMVKRALEAIDGVVSATASHADGVAFVTLNGDVDHALLRTAVEEEDFTVLSIE